jgi:hypothetical protein
MLGSFAFLELTSKHMLCVLFGKRNTNPKSASREASAEHLEDPQCDRIAGNTCQPKAHQSNQMSTTPTWQTCNVQTSCSQAVASIKKMAMVLNEKSKTIIICWLSFDKAWKGKGMHKSQSQHAHVQLSPQPQDAIHWIWTSATLHNLARFLMPHLFHDLIEPY